METKYYNARFFSSVSVFLWLIFFLTGSAAPETVTPLQPGDVADAGKIKIAQAGDYADIRYLCKLPNGEVVAATDRVAKDQPKSAVFSSRDEEGPFSVTVAVPLPELPPGIDMAFEAEITYRLAEAVVGMKEGERRQVKLTAQDILTRSEKSYVARLSRIRKRLKEMEMPLGDYQLRAQRSPEVGQPFAIDPAFPGQVETVTDQKVVIRFAKPGDVIETPFGRGHIRETEKNYEIEIDARKGTLVRAGNIVGRIADVDDQVITLDFRNPFGGETLICDVTLEKVADAKPAEISQKK